MSSKVFFAKVCRLCPRLMKNFNILGDKIASCHTRKKYEVTELGIVHPEEVPTDSLRPGQVGYIACNMKESSEGMIFWSFFL